MKTKLRLPFSALAVLALATPSSVFADDPAIGQTVFNPAVRTALPAETDAGAVPTTINGTLSVQPGGDIEMGGFTATP